MTLTSHVAILVWFAVKVASGETYNCTSIEPWDLNLTMTNNSNDSYSGYTLENSCNLTTISCSNSSTNSETCNIICNGIETCAYKELDCGTAPECYVYCNSSNSCRNTTIKGINAGYLEIIMFTSGDIPETSESTVTNAVVYCPRADYNDCNRTFSPNKNCKFSCATNSDPQSCDSFTIKAVEGS